MLDDVADAVEVAVVGREGDGRIEVAVDVDVEDDEDPVRIWGWRSGLEFDGEATGDGVPRLALCAGDAPRTGTLCPLLCPL